MGCKIIRVLLLLLKRSLDLPIKQLEIKGKNK